jgi:zinc transport system substrate-binding protein
MMPVVSRPRLVALACVVAAAAGCGDSDPSVRAEQMDKPVVITALHPLAEAVEQVAGDDVVVIDLVPVGESPHELELTPRQRDEIAAADLAIVLGKGFQPELEREAARRDGPTLDVLVALGLPDRPGGRPGPVEPHVWLDPTIMGTIVTTIAEEVASLLPGAASAIDRRADRIVEKHVELDAQLRQGLRGCTHEVIASQHEAFGWFAARYGLTNVGFDAALPDDDPAPDPDMAAEVGALLEDGTVRTIFTDTLTASGFLQQIADDERVDLAVLNAYEGLTPREVGVEATYRSVLLYDLAALQDALECTE